MSTGGEAVGEAMGLARRLWAASFSVLVIVAVLWPMLREPRVDGFPLSTYPMFSHGRERARAEIFHVVGFSREGRHRPMSPELLGTSEIMQAYQTARVAIRSGHSGELCERVAERVRVDPEHADIDRLEVRSDVYDSLAYFDGDTKPRSTRVHARCSVAQEEAPR